MSIFISYRRAGGKDVAEKIYEMLANDYRVFLDQESLKNGRFKPEIELNIQKCDDFILIVTESTFNRCLEPEDWIYREVCYALQKEKNIIPVFVDTTEFPKNIPNELAAIRDYNAIQWEEQSQMFETRLKSFLQSNKKLVLGLKKKEDGIELDEKTKERLKDMSERITIYGRKEIDVDISIENVDELSECFIAEAVSLGYEGEDAKQYAKRCFLSRFYNSNKVLCVAFEYMLQDEMLDACGRRLQDYYTKKYGHDTCFYINANGLPCFRWLYLVWLDIIEELLKEFVCERIYKNMNNKELKAIDCFVQTKSGREIWHFVSTVPVTNEETIIDIPGGYGDYFDVSAMDLVMHIYPDLYFNIGLLKIHGGHPSFEEVNKIPGVFNLYYYNFGPH